MEWNQVINEEGGSKKTESDPGKGKGGILALLVLTEGQNTQLIPTGKNNHKIMRSFFMRNDNCVTTSFIFLRKNSTKTLIERFWDKLDIELNKTPSDNQKSTHTSDAEYKDTVLKLLDSEKCKKHTIDDLEKLQLEIESLTTDFENYRNLWQTSPKIIKMLIKEEKPSARDYLRTKDLTSDDLEIIESFDQYTLEGIIIYALGFLFNRINEMPAVRVSTLIDQLDSLSKVQSRLIKDRNISLNKKNKNQTLDENQKMVKPVDNKEDKNNSKKEKRSKKEKAYSIGNYLVQFLDEREMIRLSNDLDFTEKNRTMKKNDKYYSQKTLFVILNFDMSLLPLKFNLPMVCPPLPWQNKNPKASYRPKSLSDLTGGYLSYPLGNFYSIYRYKLLSTRDMNHFHIMLGDKYKVLLETMNELQKVPFEINSNLLKILLNSRSLLEQSGLLMPKHLASLNVNNAINLLRKTYLEDPLLGNEIEYKEILHLFLIRIQRASYEDFIIKLASAYEGYRFYLPAFLDFRGRIYRAGVLHFHERDLARSLIVFSDIPPLKDDDHQIMQLLYILKTAAAFHSKKFNDYNESLDWYEQEIKEKDPFTLESLIQLAEDAREPFQFLSKVLSIEGLDRPGFEDYNKIHPYQIPITQDASASAFQIVSFFLINRELASYTNLIPTNNKINDIYTQLQEEVMSYLRGCLSNKDLLEIISSRLTRPLIKRLFMPIVYGKTVHSMGEDLYQHFKNLLSKKECKLLAEEINLFFNERFPGIINLMTLIRNVGWIKSALNKPVFYSLGKLFTTSQDYMKSKAVNIWVYDRLNKKRRQVSLRMPTDERDRRKTSSSTFANFIHQKDALIAIIMIMSVISQLNAPIYTVHDNFITTAYYADQFPSKYIEIYTNLMGNPLDLVNHYIYHNLMADHHLEVDYSQPFSSEIMSEISKLIPDGLNKTKKKIWVRKIEEIREAYNFYINEICPRERISDENYNMFVKQNTSEEFKNKLNGYLYSENWESFKSELSSWNKCSINYSIHH